MSCERGAASESLLAVGIRALVRSLAGVNSAVTGERAAIAERLCAC